jgi:hypothetical protein
MHVRDEHVRGRETKSRLKRRFEADGAAQKSAQMDSGPSLTSQHVPPIDEVIDGQCPTFDIVKKIMIHNLLLRYFVRVFSTIRIRSFCFHSGCPSPIQLYAAGTGTHRWIFSHYSSAHPASG